MSKFFTIFLNNTTNSTIPMKFNQTLSIPILEKPSDYDVSIVRFSLPNFNTPILTFKDDFYKMSMSYNGNTVYSNAVFVPRDDGNDTLVFEMSQITQILNATVDNLYTLLSAVVVLPTSEMPYFVYDNKTRFISLIGNKNYFASDLATPISLAVNEALFTWVYGLPAFNHVGTEYSDLLFLDLGNNVSGDYMTMEQENPSFDVLSDFNGVVLTSNLPIENEYIGSNIRLPVIQDYTPSDLNMETFYNNIVYNATFPYRMTHLTSDCSFYSIQIDCYVSNNAGNLTLMTLPPNQSANIKLMFCKHNKNPFA